MMCTRYLGKRLSPWLILSSKNISKFKVTYINQIKKVLQKQSKSVTLHCGLGKKIITLRNLLRLSSPVVTFIYCWKYEMFKEFCCQQLFTVAQCSSLYDSTFDQKDKQTQPFIVRIFNSFLLFMRATHLFLVFFPLLLCYPLTGK